MSEAQLLKPHLAILNQGKAAKNGLGSMKSVAYYVSDTAGVSSPGRSEASASYLYDWLHKEDSILRGLLTYLSGGGAFFVAQCHEKTLRAYVAHGGGTKEAMIAASKAREAFAAGPSDMGGLVS